MLAVKGIYENGLVRLEKELPIKEPLKVIVTFLEYPDNQVSEKLSFNNFSFLSARKKSESYKGSLSDAVIEERKSAL